MRYFVYENLQDNQVRAEQLPEPLFLCKLSFFVVQLDVQYIFTYLQCRESKGKATFQAALANHTIKSVVVTSKANGSCLSVL